MVVASFVEDLPNNSGTSIVTEVLSPRQAIGIMVRNLLKADNKLVADIYE